MPFKGLTAPKRRLASILSLAERRGLARAMLKDVLSALWASGGLDRLLIVSRDAIALDLTVAPGAEWLVDNGRPGYRSAAEQVATMARVAGAAGLLIVPADLPLVVPSELECLLTISERVDVVLAPSRSGRGTNALLVRPPGVIPYRYGANSFQAHLAEAKRAGLNTFVLERPGFALDIDEPDDLGVFLARDDSTARGSAAWRYLEEIRLAERVRALEARG